MLTEPAAPGQVVPGIGRWSRPPPTPGDVVVVVAPHPDDEVIGAGVLLRWLSELGRPLVIVACTDGEASHPRSSAVSTTELRVRRAEERAAALAVLGVEPEVHRLGRPDGALAAHIAAVAAAVEAHCPPGTTVVVPWEHDDHPDHHAAFLAGRVAARRRRGTLWRVPIWGKVRPPARWPSPMGRLVLDDDARRRKDAAVACFGSQVHALGRGPDDGPVLHPGELAAMLDGTELVLW